MKNARLMAIQTNVHNLQSHLAYQRILQQTSTFLDSNGYTRVLTPLLSSVIIPEAHLDIFTTSQRFAGNVTPLYLVPHPELFLKRLIQEGFGSCYSLGSVFRNSEPNTIRHSPEFTMLEFYKVGADMWALADDVLALIQTLASRQNIIWNNCNIDLSKWEKISVEEAFTKYAGITDLLDETKFIRQARDLGYTTDGFSYSDVWSQLYTDKVESHLGTNGYPTLIYNYPPAVGATSKLNTSTGWVERFEVYMAGIELGNAANEQASDQSIEELQAQYNQANAERDILGLTPITPDLEFAQIVKNIPACAGIGVGMERLSMILLGLESIDELNLFSYQHIDE